MGQNQIQPLPIHHELLPPQSYYVGGGTGVPLAEQWLVATSRQQYASVASGWIVPSKTHCAETMTSAQPAGVVSTHYQVLALNSSPKTKR
jgi:hypothetical protein